MHILTKLGTEVPSLWHSAVKLQPNTWSENRQKGYQRCLLFPLYVDHSQKPKNLIKLYALISVYFTFYVALVPDSL